MKNDSFQPLSAEDLAEIKEWLKNNAEQLPTKIRLALENYERLCNMKSASRAKLLRMLLELQRSMGIIASSEKRNSKDPIGAISQGDKKRPKNKKEQLQLNMERLQHLAAWHKNLARNHNRKAKRIEDKLQKVEEIELTNEEQAEAAEETRRLFEFAKLGDEAQPEFQSVTETLMTGSHIVVGEVHDVVTADLTPFPEAKVIKTVVENRERYDFSLSITKVILELEKQVIVDGAGVRRMVSPSTAEWGPPGYLVTWDFLANMVILIAQYALPMNRLAGMLSTAEQRFTAGYFSRLFKYVAHRLVPIYLQLFEDLPNSDVLMGDDTTSRVLEVQRYFKNNNPEENAPWYAYRTRDAAQKTAKEIEQKGKNPSLGVLLAQELGFEFDKRSGSGTKISLKTTTISGRSIPADPRSLVVIYRSHLGGLGNLLEVLLENRQRVNKDLTIQSDLSTVNLITNPQLCEYFNIQYAGCASHARRTFALYEQEDPDACSHMLHLFKGLFINERILDTYGRNRENVIAVRDNDSRSTWNDILALAQEMSKRWSPETKLGNAARYILRHDKALMLYLKDPRLSLTNNFSEKMLRMEKLIEESALFRSKLEGRFALDIIRSVLQTAVASQVPVQEYLLHVLQTPPQEIKEAPERFTPFAYANASSSSSDDEPAPNTS